jgi:hypothetical protein
MRKDFEVMWDMALHFEVIRDKEMINTELLHSKSMGYQLAVCYRDDERLVVRICNVMDIAQNGNSVAVTLRSDANSELIIGLDTIESIYPIHAFRK